MDKKVKLFMEKLKKVSDFDRVKFVILFGSQAFGKANSMSDYDFAVYYDGNEDQRYKFKLRVNFDEKYDVKVFQDIPLFIKKEILKGEIIYAQDLSFVSDIAYKTIKEFERFKKYYYDYISRRSIVK
ncbi:MAG: nucleotidyltransferase domain-containing protein [Nanoarchaeota archaeon]